MVKSIKKKRTKAQTPAKPNERIKGSRANPKGSASGSRGGVELSAKVIKALENMRDEHNDAFDLGVRMVNLGQLKAVYRRGAGAFSVSHRPNMSRNGWAMARVRAFLKLAGRDQRKKAYTGDLDLLPDGHPSKPKDQKRSELNAKRYSHIDFTPPKAAQEAGRRALEVREKKPISQRGMTPVGIARARDLSNGKELSPETVKRMLNYFTRHEIDKQGSTWDDQGKGWQAWQGWGGDAGYAWARKIVKQMNAADKKAQALRAYSETSNSRATYDLPEGLTIGRPFKTLSLGQVSSRMSGENVGKEITAEMLSEMLRVFRARREQDPVVIDWQHATSPFQDGPPAPPESGNALGLIADLELREDGLYAIPAYNERGLSVVTSAGGVLWSSPEFLAGDVYDRSGGERIGGAQLLAVTLTPRPAQSHNTIDRVTLNERLSDMDNLETMDLDDLKQLLIAKDEMVKQLEAQIKEMKSDEQSKLSSGENLEEKSDDEDSDKMAEEKEEEKMMERKEYNKMSESLSPALLSEINALRERNSDMARRLEIIETEKRDMERDTAVSALLREGKIEPSQKTVAGKAWELKEVQPEFWQMFSERPAGQAVPLQEIGHGASGREITRQTLDQEIKKLAAEKSISYSEALTTIRAQRPDFYTKAFGG